MKRFRGWVWLWLSSLLIGSGLAAMPQAGKMPWKVGQPAPHVHLPRLGDGQETQLSDYLGQRILLIEFASW